MDAGSSIIWYKKPKQDYTVPSRYICVKSPVIFSRGKRLLNVFFDQHTLYFISSHLNYIKMIPSMTVGEYVTT